MPKDPTARRYPDMFRGAVPTPETEPFKRAKAEGRDLEELQQLASGARPTKMGLPTTWQNRDGGVVIRGRDAPIVSEATEGEVQSFGVPSLTCGSCKYFDIEAGRKKIIEERFAERLVLEEEWQLRHLGVPADSLGMCARTDDMATTIVSKACEQYVPKDGKAGDWQP